MSNMDQDLKEYRSKLIVAEQTAQGEYDKTILTLSGGSFGISFAFVEHFIKNTVESKFWLMSSWIAWGLSITCIVFSFYFSTLAIRRAIDQVDKKTIYEQDPGQHYSKIVGYLNMMGGLLFMIGFFLLVVFVSKSL